MSFAGVLGEIAQHVDAKTAINRSVFSQPGGVNLHLLRAQVGEATRAPPPPLGLSGRSGSGDSDEERDHRDAKRESGDAVSELPRTAVTLASRMRPPHEFRRAHDAFVRLVEKPEAACPVALTDDRVMVVYCLDENVAKQIAGYGQRLVADINKKAREPVLVVNIDPVAVGEPMLLLARVLGELRSRLDDLSA